MNEKTIKTLEFNRIKEQIASFAATKSAKENILSLVASTNENKINDELDLLETAYSHVVSFGAVGFSSYEEISDYVVLAKKKGVLTPGVLLKIARMIKISREVKRELLLQKEDTLLTSYVNSLSPLKNIETLIENSVADENSLLDNASKELSSIRRNIFDTNSRIKEKLQSYVTSSTYKKMLSDSFVTTRMGRFVLPVKSEYQNSISGIVHDISSSGLTVYIEPSAISKMNNSLRELEILEKKETERILASISLEVASYSEDLLLNEEIIVFLDELFAKATYAFENHHTRPSFLKSPGVKLFNAFHPIIGYEKSVKSDIIVPDDVNAVVITGPNTGGKTVSLKTVGLCSLMASSSLFIPSQENSSIYLFDTVYADIGDEQSIAQNLSTFSSHMKNIVSILSHATKNSLVLLDELGSGTDPQEGAALAMAVIEYLMNEKATLFATTHYSEIKKFALIFPGVINASMEFDVATLSPTYRLSVGIPGKSNAFEISRKLGLNEEILKRAHEHLNTENKEFERLISSLQDKLATINKNYDESEALRISYEEKSSQLNRLISEQKNKEDAILASATVKAAKIVDRAKNETADILEELKRAREKAASKEILSRLDDIDRQLTKRVQKKKEPNYENGEIFVGDSVYLTKMGVEGEVTEISGDKKTISVLSGALSMKAKIKDVKKIKTNAKDTYISSSFVNTKMADVPAKLDLRGKNSMDVEMDVAKYLDDAFLAKLKVVTIVHGKGEGILRDQVRKILSRNQLVERFRTGESGEGGAGATIVYLK